VIGDHYLIWVTTDEILCGNIGAMQDKPSVVVTRRMPEAVHARLLRDYRVVPNEDDHAFSAEELISAARDAQADALLICATDPMDADVIAALPDSVKTIATFAVGVDNIDLAAAKARGIVVANTPDVLTDACADIAMLLTLAAARRAYEGDQMVRTGAWVGWRPTQLLGRDLQRKRLGIFGMGRIGRAYAKRAKAFGMKIHYCNRSRLDRRSEGGAIFHQDIEEMLPLCEFFSINAPATPETKGFLNAERIARLPEGSIVVNIARGDLINDEALIAALKSGHVAAAGLDVFAGEPDIHPGYRELPNVFLMPHAGSATIETRDRMGLACIDAFDAFFSGRPVPTQVA